MFHITAHTYNHPREPRDRTQLYRSAPLRGQFWYSTVVAYKGPTPTTGVSRPLYTTVGATQLMKIC